MNKLDETSNYSEQNCGFMGLNIVGNILDNDSTLVNTIYVKADILMNNY